MSSLRKAISSLIQGYHGSAGWLFGRWKRGVSVDGQTPASRGSKTSDWDWAYLHRNKHAVLCLFENKGRSIHNAK
jgi:hypothetical protein